jgi:hypothetical protein
MKTFDDRLDTLRKAGFTFITGLITTSAVITYTVNNTPTPPTTFPNLPDIVKFTILLGTLVLIGALNFIDKGYRVFQLSIFHRLRVLERRLNLELSETIANRNVAWLIHDGVYLIYGLFAAVVVIFGWGALAGDPYFMAFLGTLFIVGGFASLFPIAIRTNYAHGKMDWTISPLELTKGDDLRITVTNLDEENIIEYPAGMTIFKVQDQDGNVVHRQRVCKKISIANSFTWIMNWKDFPHKGIYRIYPTEWDPPKCKGQPPLITKWAKPLRREVFRKDDPDLAPIQEVREGVDWTISPSEVSDLPTSKDLRITITNLLGEEHPITFAADEPMFEIWHQHGPDAKTVTVSWTESFPVTIYNTYSCILDSSYFPKKGIYRLYPATRNPPRGIYAFPLRKEILRT